MAEGSGFGLGATGCIILPASLFIGLMIAGPGTAVYPPISTVAAPLICGGTVDVQSDYYSVRPGENGVSRTIWCITGDGKGSRSDITWSAIGIAFLLYSALAFLILRFLVAPWLRRRARRALLSAGIDPRARPGFRTVLAQVKEAARQESPVPPHRAGGEDAGERLARLRQLRDSGLISDEDYEAKKAEILSGL